MKDRKANSIRCPICGYDFSRLRFLEHYALELGLKTCIQQSERNLGIIKKVGFRNVRANLAIYRLYRYCDMSPYWISVALEGSGFKTTPYRLQGIIGSVFKALCMKDDKCVFRKLLMQNQTANPSVACRVSVKKTKEV